MPFNEARMLRNEKILKLFESGVGYSALMERFGLRAAQVADCLRYARERREMAKRAKEKAE